MSEEDKVWLGKWAATIVAGIIAVVLLLILASTAPDHTCPNYGEVPALIDGEHVCVEWEVQP